MTIGLLNQTKMRVLISILLLVVLVALVSSASIKGQGRRKSKSKAGSIKNRGKGPSKVNGKFKFEEEIDVDINIQGRGTANKRLRKQNIDTSRGLGVKTSGVYVGDGVILRQECPEGPNGYVCREFALVTDDNGDSTYINDKGQALTIDHSEGVALSTATPPELPVVPSGKSSKGNNARGSSNRKNNKPRRRRALVDNLTSARVIKLLMFVDKAFLEIFKEMGNTDEAGAKVEVEKYLTLVVNEMTVHYQTLREYGQTMTVDGTATAMDVAVSLVHIEYPESGTDFAFAAPNIVGENIYATTIQDANGYYSYTGLLGDTRDYVANDYQAPANIVFDHAAYLTGYDLKSTTISNTGSNNTGDILGLAWTSTLCEANSKQFGYHTSANEIDGFFARVLAHELGHGFGMSHDIDNGCPDSEYIMSRAIFSPRSSTSDTYFKFSSCSATDVSTFTAGIAGSNFESTCLQPAGEEDLDAFCSGFTGNSGNYNLDQQCELGFGPGSSRYSYTNDLKEQRLQAGYVETCVSADDYSQYPFVCQSGTGSLFYMSAAAPGTNCVPPDGSLNQNYVCFNGECINQEEICALPTTTTTTAPTTTSTTTTKPTTTTTTTAPTTTSTTTEPTTSSTTTTKPTTTTTTTEPTTTTTTTTEPTTTTTSTTEPTTTTTTTTKPTTTTTTTTKPTTTTTTTTEPTTTTTSTTEPTTTTTTTTKPTTTTTTTEPTTTTTTTTEPTTTTTTTTKPTTTTTTKEPTTTTTTTTKPTTTTTTKEPTTTTTTTTTEPTTTTTTTTKPTTTTTTTEPTTTTTTKKPTTTTTTTTEPSTTTTTTKEPTTTKTTTTEPTTPTTTTPTEHTTTTTSTESTTKTTATDPMTTTTSTEATTLVPFCPVGGCTNKRCCASISRKLCSRCPGCIPKGRNCKQFRNGNKWGQKG